MIIAFIDLKYSKFVICLSIVKNNERTTDFPLWDLKQFLVAVAFMNGKIDEPMDNVVVVFFLLQFLPAHSWYDSVA